MTDKTETVPSCTESGPQPRIAVEALTSHLGARVTGVDFAQGVDDVAFGEIYRAFLDWHVLSIRGQNLQPAQVLELSRRFGPVEPHIRKGVTHPDTDLVIVLSNRMVDGKPMGSRDGGTFWHSDVSYREIPAKATLLYSVEVPEEGGDTLFADTTRAYEELPSAMKRRLEGLQALHDYSKADEISKAQGAQRRPLTEEERKQVPPVPHPVVRVHPETGRKSLYINPAYTRCILDLPEEESDALLEELFAHCLQPQYQLTYRWEAGDVVIWDNAAVIHSATALLTPIKGHRTLWRTIIVGEQPR